MLIPLRRGISHGDAPNLAPVRESSGLRPEPQQRELGPSRHRLSAHVAVQVCLGDDAAARITSRHGPIRDLSSYRVHGARVPL